MQNAVPAVSVQEMTAMKGVSNVVHIVVVDDDDLFRETLALNLEHVVN